MPLCPFATQKPVSNHGGPMSAHLGVVIHVTAGESDPGDWFANPASQVSSHFGIGNGQGDMADGALEQYVDTDLCSWAQVEGNASYISVETEGEPTEALTPAQIATFARLYAWIMATHGVPAVITDTPGQTGFITHGDGGATWGGHTGCPGPLRSPQRSAILAALAPPLPSPAPPTPPVTIGDDMQQTTIQVSITGGNGWCACPEGVNDSSLVSVIAEAQSPSKVGEYVPVPAFVGISTDPPELIFEGSCPDGLYGFIVKYVG